MISLARDEFTPKARRAVAIGSSQAYTQPGPMGDGPRRSYYLFHAYFLAGMLTIVSSLNSSYSFALSAFSSSI